MGRNFSTSVNVEEVFSREDIKSMTTDEIHRCMVHFKKLIREGRVSGRNTRDYEVEYCYLDNESQSRSKYEFTSPRPSDPRKFRSSERDPRKFRSSERDIKRGHS